MEIQGISSLLSSISSTRDTTEKSGDISFSSILTDAINNAVETDTSNAIDTLSLLSGGDTEIHTSMIEAEKSELALNLAIQIRNKVIDAYNEIMRMSV